MAERQPKDSDAVLRRPGDPPGRQGDPRMAPVTMVGFSRTEVCGVRDYAEVVGDELSRRGVEVTTVWADVPHTLPIRERRRRYRQALDKAVAAARSSGDGWLVVHYSVFTFAYRGFPVFVPTLVRRLRRASRICVIAHELCVPWTWKSSIGGRAVALLQRSALLPLMYAADAVVVTEDRRREWLGQACLLPRRRVTSIPVPSNLPVVDVPTVATVAGRVGVSGSSFDAVDPALVAGALAAVRRDGIDAHVLMLGAPGSDSAAGRRWAEALSAEGVPAEFTGIVSRRALADSYASCDAIVQPDLIGPSPRRTSFSAALASGRPVVVFDGEQGWESVGERGAAAVVMPTAAALGDRLRDLLTDRSQAAELGSRGRAFYDREASVEAVVARLAGFLSLDRSASVGRALVVSHPAVVSVNQEPYRALARLGWEVDVIAPASWRHGYRDGAFAPEVLAELEDRVHPVPVFLPGREQRHVYRARIGAILRRFQPDVVLLEEETYALSAAQWGRACARRRIPFGVQADENIDRTLPAPARRLHRWVLAHAALITARSEAARSLCRKWGAVGAVEVVPHHIADLGDPPDIEHPFTLGYAGRLVTEKGVEDLIDAAALVVPVPRVVIVGNGPLRTSLEERAATRGVPAEVLTTVPHESMATAYAEMDVLVLPSRTTPTWTEQFGRVLAEALSCGVPVIGSDSGEIPRVVAETGGGWTFPEGDVEALARLITEVRDDPDERRRRALQGRAVVDRRYSATAVADLLDRHLGAMMADA